jgi:hypothetical protein
LIPASLSRECVEHLNWIDSKIFFYLISFDIIKECILDTSLSKSQFWSSNNETACFINCHWFQHPWIENVLNIWTGSIRIYFINLISFDIIRECIWDTSLSKSQFWSSNNGTVCFINCHWFRHPRIENVMNIWNGSIQISFFKFDKFWLHKTGHIRHLFMEISILSCHSCLIFNIAEIMTNN